MRRLSETSICAYIARRATSASASEYANRSEARTPAQSISRAAVHSFRRYPPFAGLAAVIVALGAGANAAVFLRRARRPAAAAAVRASRPFRGNRATAFLSIRDVDFLRGRSRAFLDVAASSPGWLMPLTGVGDPVQIITARP